MGCGCAAGNGPISDAGGVVLAWRTRGKLGGSMQPPPTPAGQGVNGMGLVAVKQASYTPLAAPLAEVVRRTLAPYYTTPTQSFSEAAYAPWKWSTVDVAAQESVATPLPADADSYLALLQLNCQGWLALSQKQRFEMVAGQVAKHSVFANSSQTLSAAGHAYAIRIAQWLDLHCLQSKTAPAGQIYPILPYSMPYPTELLSDCARWRGLTREQKFALASQTVPAERVALVVADLDLACGAPYSYSVYPYSYAYPLIFPTFYTRWSSGGFHGGGGGGGHHHPAGEPINPAG